MFYAQNLMGQIQREMLILEKERGVEPAPEDGSRFSLRTSRQLANMYERLVVLEGSDAKTAASPEPEAADDNGLTQPTAAGA